MLHLIESSLTTLVMRDLVKQLTPKDVLVLLNDGVYIDLSGLPIPCPCFILAKDVELRGVDLPVSSQGTSISCISMEQVVELACQHSNSATW